MPKQNPYFITENYKKTEEIRMIESDFDKSQPIRQLEEKEQLAEQQKIEASYYEEFESYNDLGIARSYGPGNSSSSETVKVRWKKFTIQDADKYVNRIKFKLDDEVEFSNGSFYYINCDNTSPFNDYDRGYEIELDLEKIKKMASTDKISSTAVVKIANAEKYRKIREDRDRIRELMERVETHEDMRLVHKEVNFLKPDGTPHREAEWYYERK